MKGLFEEEDENPVVTYYRLAERIATSSNMPEEEKQKNLSDLEKLLRAATVNPVSGGNNIHVMRYLLQDLLGAYVIAIDIDNFCDLNRTFGHTHGDMVLREFMEYLDKNLRKDGKRQLQGDVIHLYGEEFIIITHASDEGEAEKLANRLREGFHNYTFDNLGTFKRPVTFSAGIANYVKGRVALSEAMQKADRACYEAKNSGRNRVVPNSL